MSTFLDTEPDHLATPSEACREFAFNYGSTCPERAWLSTDFDTWERNPHYTGPSVPHPEFDDGRAPEDSEVDTAPPVVVAQADCGDDDVPF